MGFIVLLKFSLLCIDFLAWPVIALGYPLFASIRAIETGAVHPMRKVVIYWTIFSLISLFEYAFVKFIEWIPFWSSIKLVVIFLLVLPRFQGASYSYQRFIRPCLVVYLQEAIESFYKPKEEQEQPLTKEMILGVVEEYLKENGSEALEKIITSKKDIQFMEPYEKNVTVASKQLEEPGDGDHKGKEVLKSPRKIAATETRKIWPHAQLVTSFWVPKETSAKTKDAITPETETCVENKKPTTTHDQNQPSWQFQVEQDWACPLCQVVTTSEKDLNSHLMGKRHKSICESLNPSKPSALETVPSSSTGKPCHGKNQVWRRILEKSPK